MIVQSYLRWSQAAGPEDRAEAVAMLCEVLLAGEMSTEDRRDAIAALMLALDDTSPIVRRAMAVSLGGSEFAPRPVITALVHDLPEIARIVLANSPVLSDAELMDALAVADVGTQAAIAQRPFVSVSVAAAFAEAAAPEALALLVANEGAEITPSLLQRMVVREGGSPILREALLARDDLPADARASLAITLARQLSDHACAQGWMSDERAKRMQLDRRDSALIEIVAAAPADGLSDAVSAIRKAGAMTPQLLLRALLCAEDRFFAAALADLAGQPADRAFAIVAGQHASGLKALLKKAGLPDGLTPAFITATDALHTQRRKGAVLEAGRFVGPVIEQVMVACAASSDPLLMKLLPVLGRHQVEAARDEARRRVDALVTLAPALEDEFDRSRLIEQQLEDSLRIEFRQAA